MGCSSSVVVPACGGVETTRGHHPGKKSAVLPKNGTCSSRGKEQEVLTPTQKRLVSDSMHRLKPRLDEVGVHVFATIFAMQPGVKKLFGFGDMPVDDLRKDARFRGHASRFMEAVCIAVDLLSKNGDSSRQLEQFFHSLGAKHLNVPGFHRSDFSLFRQALLHCLGQQLGGEGTFKGDLYQAWDAMLKHIIHSLQAGYTHALDRVSTDSHITHIIDGNDDPAVLDPTKNKLKATTES